MSVLQYWTFRDRHFCSFLATHCGGAATVSDRCYILSITSYAGRNHLGLNSMPWQLWQHSVSAVVSLYGEEEGMRGASGQTLV